MLVIKCAAVCRQDFRPRILRPIPLEQLDKRLVRSLINSGSVPDDDLFIEAVEVPRMERKPYFGVIGVVPLQIPEYMIPLTVARTAVIADAFAVFESVLMSYRKLPIILRTDFPHVVTPGVGPN